MWNVDTWKILLKSPKSNTVVFPVLHHSLYIVHRISEILLPDNTFSVDEIIAFQVFLEAF